MIQQEQILEKTTKDVMNELVQSIRNSQTDDEKISQTHELCELISNLNTMNFTLIDEDLCVAMCWLIDNCNPSVQKEIFGLIELIVQKGARMTKKYNWNKLFGLIKKSELLHIIQRNIQEYILYQQNKEIILQLIRIFCFINKGQWIGSEMLEICKLIFNREINKLIDIVTVESQRQQNEEVEEQETRNDEEIDEGIKTLEALSYVSEDFYNGDYFCKQCLMHIKICTFYHINCDPSLNCNNQLSLPNKLQTQQLKTVSIRALESLAFMKAEIKQFFIQDHQILPHLTSIILQFETSQTNKNKSVLNQQISYQSFSQTSNCLDLFYTLLMDNKLLSEQSVIVPDLIPALIQLSQFMRKRKGLEFNQDLNPHLIRNGSLKCLSQIQYHIRGYLQVILIEQYQFMKNVIVDAIQNNKEEDNDLIERALILLRQFISILRTGINQNLIQSNGENVGIKLLIGAVEQIEQYNIIEEVDAHIFHTKEEQNSVINEQAQISKDSLQFINKGKEQ